MKWGRKKKQSFPGSSRPFVISQVLPWMSKFKQMGIDSGRGDREMKQKGKGNSASGNSGKFYGGDNDGGAFWRLSFGEAEEEFCSVRYDDDDDNDDGVRFQQPSCRNCTLNSSGRVNGKVDGYSKFSTVARGKISQKFTQNAEVSPCVREKVAEIRTPRLRVDKEKKLRNRNRRVFEENQVDFEGRKDCCIAPLDSRDRYLRKLEEFAAENGSDIVTERQKLKERKIKELKSRNEEQRKSLYISRELQRKTPKQHSKVRGFSPRTASRAEICKIKAFEDMKRAKLQTKKKAKEKKIDGFRGLESFAVAQYSYDPQHDFKESMIEMIEERRISKPEELEELLACYLTLNSDEYHDLIIKVFKQVWFDMSRACFELETELDK